MSDDDHVDVLGDMLMAMLGAVFVLLFIFSALARDYVGAIGRQRAAEDARQSAVSGARLPIERPLILVRAAGYRLVDLECELRDPSGRLIATLMSTDLHAPVSFADGRAMVALEATGRFSAPEALTPSTATPPVRPKPLTSFQFELAVTSPGSIDLDGYAVRVTFKPADRLARQDVINAQMVSLRDVRLTPTLNALLADIGLGQTADVTPEIARHLEQLFETTQSLQAEDTIVLGPLRAVYENLTKRPVPPNGELDVHVEAIGLSGDTGVFVGILQGESNASQSCDFVLKRNLDVRLELPSSVVLRP